MPVAHTTPAVSTRMMVNMQGACHALLGILLQLRVHPSSDECNMPSEQDGTQPKGASTAQQAGIWYQPAAGIVCLSEYY